MSRDGGLEEFEEFFWARQRRFLLRNAFLKHRQPTVAFRTPRTALLPLPLRHDGG